jgi:hypothetical protein
MTHDGPFDLDNARHVAALNRWIDEVLGPEPDVTACPFCGTEDIIRMDRAPDGMRLWLCGNVGCPSAVHGYYFDERDVRGDYNAD